jgi:thiol-disulfide isomerase/thioredoxin
MVNKVILYHANWCGFCNLFMDEWDKLKMFSDEHPDLLEVEEFEQTKYPDVMKLKKIEGYPTILIIKDGNEESYKGNRTADDILEYMGINKNINQSGGNMMHDKYYEKYLKYKMKYEQLKKKNY